MKNKIVKNTMIILGSIFIIAVVFFLIDYSRVKNQQLPIFCIKIAEANDGGTQIYIGLGYKVIDFNKMNGYNSIKIGTVFMRYEDFEEEYHNFRKPQESKRSELNQTEDIKMTIKEGTLNKTSATIIITSKNEKPYSYGEEYKIDKRENGEWKELKPIDENYCFNAIGYLAKEGKNSEIEINWKELYGELKKGEYRIIKNIYIDTDKYFSVEFEIEG